MSPSSIVLIASNEVFRAYKKVETRGLPVVTILSDIVITVAPAFQALPMFGYMYSVSVYKKAASPRYTFKVNFVLPFYEDMVMILSSNRVYLTSYYELFYRSN